MHDNEIIELLEDCCDGRVVITTIYNDLEYDITLQDIYDLISRQKTEIERLTLEKENLRCVIDDLSNNTKYAKSEAVREFAEKLKQQAFSCDVSFGFGKEHCKSAVSVIDIDNLLKEMTEGKNG